ncbi:MAG TPA: tyrosine--tRNA ligase [Candidatus Paceibacterota bacterium]|nr:tyrosine--tRNA ligase [Candidatus Paceibacterota bacterium]
MNKVDQKRIDELFARGTVTDVYPSKEALVKKMLAGERIKIYYGLDPTHTAIHLGHAKNFIFLEELRQLGHEVIVLFGDFTAQIGDPSDKSATRKQLSKEDVVQNMSNWVRQISPLIDFKDKTNPATIRHNSEWLAKLSFADILSLSSNFTVQQMIERDMFQKRLKEGSPIHLHEFMYPLMQGYDSVAMDVDAELCGTDQIFNALSGRTLMKKLKDKEKFVIALNLIANPATGQLMSKSNGTGVFIDQSANDLFGSLMSLPDPMLEPLFVNCTRIPMNEKESIMKQGPRMAKAIIAKDIVKRIHGELAAVSAEEAFIATFAKGGVPDADEIMNIPCSPMFVNLLIEKEIIPSKAEWRRLIESGAVKYADGTKVSDLNWAPKSGDTMKIGKRRFVKFV